MTQDDIAVYNVQPGQAPLIITCDVAIAGVLVHGVTLRRGRRLATYVNMPQKFTYGAWRPVVEITDEQLLAALRSAVIAAALEATRFSPSVL